MVQARPVSSFGAIGVDPEREMAELKAYLGPAYDHSRLEHYEHQLEQELERVGDESLLYRTSEAYLYNLTAFAMTQTKAPYLQEVARAVPVGSRVLDYGCGIGSDGLALLRRATGSSSPTSTTRAPAICAGAWSAAAWRPPSTTSTPSSRRRASTWHSRST